MENSKGQTLSLRPKISYAMCQPFDASSGSEAMHKLQRSGCFVSVLGKEGEKARMHGGSADKEQLLSEQW